MATEDTTTTTTTEAPSRGDGARGTQGPDTIAPRRRAPFATNPNVGARGSRTRQRIIAAALDVFADADYLSSRIEDISDLAGCSRSAFYQYFSSKDDLFRQIAGELARALLTVSEGPAFTADASGRRAILEWLVRNTELYEAYAPMFTAFDEVAEMDDDLARRSNDVAAAQSRLLAERFGNGGFGGSPELLPHLSNMVFRAHVTRDVLDVVARTRLNEALANVIHRVAFGPRTSANLGARPQGADTSMSSSSDKPAAPGPRFDDGPASTQRERLIEEAGRCFIERSYDQVRVSDIIEAAETTRATFYRHFDGKRALFQAVALRAGSELLDVIRRIPDIAAETDELRAWAADYVAVSADNVPLTRAWIVQIRLDPAFRATSRAAHDAVRRRLVRFLEPRSFGDADAESIALMSILMETGRYHPWSGARRGGSSVDALVELIQRGFLARV